MVAYNFKAQFVPQVEALIKLQTIRGHRKRHAQPGEAIQLYTGMRTRVCRKLVTPDPICLSVRPIEIASRVNVDGSLLVGNQVDEFAIADGFESAEEFFEFFRIIHGLPFQGVVIEWRSSTAQ